MAFRPPTHSPAIISAPKYNPRGKEARNRQRRRAFHTGSKAWGQMRQEVLMRDCYTCAECGGFGNQVDHIDGDSHNNDMGNLQTLCISDHSAKTRREQDEAGRAAR